MDKNIVFYIFVNTDLNMTKGQLAPQISHITQIIVEELVKKCYEEQPPSKECMNYMRWKMNPVTIILKATTSQLQELMKQNNSRHFIDGTDRIPANSLTCVGFFPTNDLDEMVKNYRLL